VTFDVVRLLQAISNAIFRTVVPVVDKIPTDMWRRADPSRLLSVLFSRRYSEVELSSNANAVGENLHFVRRGECTNSFTVTFYTAAAAADVPFRTSHSN